MANFSAKYSIMTQEMVDSFCENFYISAEVPTALGHDKIIAQFPAGKPSTNTLSTLGEGYLYLQPWDYHHGLLLGRSSSTLSAPVDIAAATTTSTKAKLAADVNPVIWWSSLASKGYGKLLEKKDSKILRLKSQLAEKEAETAEVACTEAGTKITSLASERDRLASEVSSLRIGFKDFKEKMEIQQEEQAQELYNRVAELEAHVMDVSGRLEGEFYPTYLTLLAGRRWLLTHGIQLALLKCLKSSEYQGILGHALGRAVDFGMQEGLEAGYEHGVAGRSLSVVDAYNPEVASADYVNAVKALEDAHFPLVDLLKSKKDAGMDEVLDCFLLDGPLAELPEAASLQPCIEQLSIPIHHAGDKTAVGETSLSFALMNVHARAEGAKKHAAALRQLMMEIVSAPLSSQTWVGEASISAAPLSVEDYAEEDTDEALGSVVAAPHLERCCL
ncbi:hypothetical protein Tco_0282255 [Tanacetum coccineum]